MSELVKKYSLKMLKKIGLELGNAIKTACDVGRKPGGVGNVDSFGVNEQELLHVGGEIHNTEMNLELGCSEPSLKPANQVERGLSDQDASMDNVVHCKEHVISMLPVVNVETVNDVEEGADRQCQVTFDCIDNGPAQVYSGEYMGGVGHGRETSSMLRDVDEEAVDDVEHVIDQEFELPLDCNENESVVTGDELVEETTSTQPEVQDSLEGCVKKVQSKKGSFSGQEDDFSKKPLKMSRMNRDDGAVQLKTRPFSCTAKEVQKKFGSKRVQNTHLAAVHPKGRSFSCQEEGCQKKFVNMSRLTRHVTFVHLKKRPFSCQEDGCQKKFMMKTHLDEHIAAIHHRKKPFSCKEDGCQVKFGRKRDLYRHVDEVHLKKKPFKCSHCSKDFGQRQNLSTHIKIVHQKEKAFICQEPGCGKKFGAKHELQDHMRSVHGAPKLVCQKAECSATFVHASTLYRHMKWDHGDK